MKLFELTKDLIDISSITGSEAQIATFLCTVIREIGFDVREQAVEDQRKNILATTGNQTSVLLCTHMDTVPPFTPFSEDQTHIYGRGACDAKGIIAAMLVAAEELWTKKIQNFGLLFLVGEETDSKGAKIANDLNVGSDFIVVGEPTENKLAVGHKGLLTCKLTVNGKAAHSGYPELGESAINILLDLLQTLRTEDWGRDSTLGPSTLNIGTIDGGTSHNIVASKAEARFSIRTVGPSQPIIERLNVLLGSKAELEILSQSDPQRLHILPDYDQIVVSFGTDIHHLHNFGKALLIGPGSIADAHTDSERISKAALQQAVDIYVNLIVKLLKTST